MANWSSEVEFSRSITRKLNNESDEKDEERIVRRSEKVAFERNTFQSQKKASLSGGHKVLIRKGAKRKRKPPKIPWKKPEGMPKRPLSAYNLFFQSERENIVKRLSGKSSPTATRGEIERERDSPSASSDVGEGTDLDSPGKELFKDISININLSSAPKTRRPHTRTSGVGFANLAKTIASKWKTLDSETKSVFVAHANADKERYKKEMVIWRAKQQQQEKEKEEIDEEKIPSGRKSVPLSKNEILVEKNATQRRASDPLGMSSFSRHKARVALKEDNSFRYSTEPMDCWVEPSDGGSLGTLEGGAYSDFEVDDDTFTEPTQLARRCYSDSMLNFPPETYHDVRSCEEMAAELYEMGERNSWIGERNNWINEEEFRARRTGSRFPSLLQALEASLDDEMIDFITDLNQPE